MILFGDSRRSFLSCSVLIRGFFLQGSQEQPRPCLRNVDPVLFGAALSSLIRSSMLKKIPVARFGGIRSGLSGSPSKRIYPFLPEPMNQPNSQCADLPAGITRTQESAFCMWV